MDFKQYHGDGGIYWQDPSCDIAIYQTDGGGPFTLCYSPQWRDAMVELGEDASAHLSDDRPDLVLEHETLEQAMTALRAAFQID